MSEPRAGRPRKPLPSGLPPALKRFTLELRHLVAHSGVTQDRLAAHLGMSRPAVSRILSGTRPPTKAELDALIEELGLDDSQRATLAFLHGEAVKEAQGARLEGPQVSASELAARLAELRQETRLSLREISHRLTLTGSPVAKSTVERTLDDPDRTPHLALQVALVLLDALPDDERGPAADRVFRTALDATSPGYDVVTATPGSGKTETMLGMFHPSSTSPEAAVSALARLLDLPVAELIRLRDTAAQERSRIPGRPISEWNPIELGIHPAAQPIGSGHGTIRELPPYVQRTHDRLLAESVRDAAEGHSQMVVVTGSSSTGKTRACWEAIQSLQERGWRLWPPFNPAPPEAVLEGADRVAPRTVVWLDEAQRYLLPADLGERVASTLRRLLSQPERGPILILGTLWPEYLARLTAPPAADAADPHSQARELLTGKTIFIPDVFDHNALQSAEGLAAEDPRLADALALPHTPTRLTQNLASGPQLIHRYNDATPAARAVLLAAMDACRLGVTSPLPQSFLIEAAVDYLDDTLWDMLTVDWAEQAFAEVSRPVPGGPGPLRRIQPRPTASPFAAPAPAPAPGAARVQPSSAGYRLAGYLEQHGRRTRQGMCPPASFWRAAYIHLAAPEDLGSLAEAADDRYRLQWAHHLRRRAAEAQEEQGLVRLLQLQDDAGDLEEAERLVRATAGPGRTSGLRELARLQERAGEHEAAATVALQAAEYGDALALAELAWTREDAGAREEAERLARLAADIGDTYALRELARMREASGDSRSAESLYRTAADLGDSPSLLRLADLRQQAGERVETETLAFASGDTGHGIALLRSARTREEAGDRKAAETLYRQASDAGTTFALAALARMREDAGDRLGAEALYLKAADAGHAWLINPVERWPYGLNPDGAPTPPWK